MQTEKVKNFFNRSYQIPPRWNVPLAMVLILVIIGSAGLIFYQPLFGNLSVRAEQEVTTEKHVAFLLEIFDKIKKHYWKTTPDAEIVELYKLGAEKLEKKPPVTIGDNRTGLKSMLSQIVSSIESEEEKKQFAVDLATIVLYNLQPAGRSGLYTEAKEQALWDNVKNIDRETDLYEEIGVDKEDSVEKIAIAAEDKAQELSQTLNDPSLSAEEKQAAADRLAKVKRAQETLTQPHSRENYDTYGTEATVYGEIIEKDTLLLSIKKFSPITFTEFQQVANYFDQFTDLNTLILDLRGNIGGAVDIMPYFLGPFIGQGHYAYEIFHQDDYTPYKTLVGWLPSLVRYKKVIILQDDKAQSSAEVMAAVLKKFNVGILVGTNSRGWGTIEAVFDLENQISEDETYKI
ncbi:MAG: S41 family peptidase [Candidatus Komeilibacteria bacterium]|nr:S41 family peptidase [Candidatus Komeilibacteria bacterium]